MDATRFRHVSTLEMNDRVSVTFLLSHFPSSLFPLRFRWRISFLFLSHVQDRMINVSEILPLRTIEVNNGKILFTLEIGLLCLSWEVAIAFNYTRIPLIRLPIMGQKKLGRINGVTLLSGQAQISWPEGRNDKYTVHRRIRISWTSCVLIIINKQQEWRCRVQ